MERDAQLGRDARAEYELRASLERQQFLEFEKVRVQKKKEKHTQICNRMINELIGIRLYFYNVLPFDIYRHGMQSNRL